MSVMAMEVIEKSLMVTHRVNAKAKDKPTMNFIFINALMHCGVTVNASF